MFELIRYEQSIPVVPELIELPETSLLEFLESKTGAGLYALVNEHLNGFVSLSRSLGPGLEVFDLGAQRVTHKVRERQTTPLKQFLGGVKAPRIALRSAYSSPGRARQGFEALLRRLPPDRHFFIGVDQRIFQKLAADGVPPDAERERMRELRSIYLGASPLADEVRRAIHLFAPGAYPTLVEGEKGTGKERVCRAIHRFSGRRGPLVVVNAATIGRDIADLELFGSVKGAFTGAVDRPGYFEAADGGVLFLDEVGELPEAVQAKLLRAIEYGQVRRLGAVDHKQVDVKVVAATHRDLEAMVACGEFRGDLYDRLAVAIIRTPSLREHRGDCYLYVDRFWRKLGNAEPLPPSLVKLLANQDWPGNVRQLQNVLIRLMRWANGAKPTRDLVLRSLNAGRRPAYVSMAASRSARRSMPRTEEALREATRLYASARGTYVELAQLMRTVVEALLRDPVPSASVRSRTKTVASLAERLQRRWTDDLFKDVRDLSGLRVTVSSKQQKMDVIQALRGYLEIDLGPGVFRESAWGADGQPTTCWVRIDERRARKLEARLDIDLEGSAGHWSELQIVTKSEDLLLSACEEVMHGRPAVPLPEAWVDELAAVEKALERVDASFERMRGWIGSYGAYLSPEAASAEMRILETTLACAPTDATVAARAGKLAITCGDIDKAIAILTPHEGSGHGPVLRDLAVALCQTNDPGSRGYRRGLELFERACDISPRDPDAFASYAGARRRAEDVSGARDLYRRALVIDDGAPYPLGGLIEMELQLKPTSNPITSKRPAIDKAIQRCRDQIEASVGLPFAYFNLGKMLILIGKTREGLDAYVQAIGCTTAPFMYSTTLRSVEDLSAAVCVPRAIEVARKMIAIGWFARFPSETSRAALAAIPAAPPAGRKLVGPALLVIGRGGHRSSCDIGALGGVLAAAVRGFEGSVVPVGDLDRLEPAVSATRGTLSPAARLVKYRLADVASFVGGATTPLFAEDLSHQTLAPWRDLLASGVRPSSVLLLAIGDDQCTKPDRDLALQLGARVVVLLDDAGEQKKTKQGRDVTKGGHATPEIVVRDAPALRELIAKLPRR